MGAPVDPLTHFEDDPACVQMISVNGAGGQERQSNPQMNATDEEDQHLQVTSANLLHPSLLQCFMQKQKVSEAALMQQPGQVSTEVWVMVDIRMCKRKGQSTHKSLAHSDATM